MEKVLVLGAGKFGKKAVSYFSGITRQIVVVDHNPGVLLFAGNDRILPVCSDGVSYLAGNDLLGFDWIVPALPLHVAFAWLLARLKNDGIRAVSVPPGLILPGCSYLQDGTVCATLSDHLCPEDCPGPDGHCYLTGEEHKLPLFRQLSALHVDGFIIHLLRSYQLAPGLGGFTPTQLKNLLLAVSGRRLPGLLISSCDCHAVINAFAFA